MTQVHPYSVRYNARTGEATVLVDEGVAPDLRHDEIACQCPCSVPLLVRIPIVIVAMAFGAAFGFLIGLFLVPPLILAPLQWSLFMGTSANGFQNVDAMMFLFQKGKRLKTNNNKWCSHLRDFECNRRAVLCLPCCVLKWLLTPPVYVLRLIFGLLAFGTTWMWGMAWCPLLGLVTGASVPALVAYHVSASGQWRKEEIYGAFEGILIFIRIIKVQDDYNQKYNQGTTESRRKLDGTWIFYLLLCSPMVMGWCGIYITYLAYIYVFCADPYFQDEYCFMEIYGPVAGVGSLLLPLLTLGLYMLYRNRLQYLDENLVENLEEHLTPEPETDPGNPENEEPPEDFMEKYNEMLKKMQNDTTSDVPLTQEEENWVRLSFLLVEEGTQWVAKVITDYLHEQKMTFQQLLNANRKTIEKMTGGTGRPGPAARQGQKTLFSSDQFDLLFPEANLAKLDLTLLVILIGFLRLLDPPPCKWTAKKDPPHTDMDKASDLVRMRLMRNHLYAHIVECAISTDDFDVQWEKLEAILVRLGATVTTLDKLKDRETNREERRKLSERITTLFSGDLPDVEEFAAERMKELAENHKMRLQHPDNIDVDDPNEFI